MCHNKCPPQRCYWRNLSKRSLSKRSTANETYYENEQYGEPFSVGRYNFTLPRAGEPPTEANGTNVISESLSLFQALEVRHSDDTEEDYDEPASRYDHQNSEFVNSRLARKRTRKGDALRYLGKCRSNTLYSIQFAYNSNSALCLQTNSTITLAICRHITNSASPASTSPS